MPLMESFLVTKTHGGIQGRIQELKLGVAQMDWKVWKKKAYLKYDY